MELYNYKAKIIKVVDGDTVDAIIDAGFTLRFTERLRLLGINAPEMRSPDPAIRVKAKEAKVFLEGLILNKDVFIHTEKDDAFGRYLAQIYLDGDDLNNLIIDDVNKLMIINGHAVKF